MTDDYGMTFGTGPGGLLVPGDLDDRIEEEGAALGNGADVAEGQEVGPATRGNGEDRDWTDIDRHADRVVATLGNVLLREFGKLERVLEKLQENTEADAAERRAEFQTVRDELLDVKVRLSLIRDVPEDLARKFDVEDVLSNQRHEFGYLRECMAWQRGAATAGTLGTVPRSRRSAGGATALAVSGGIGGFLLCATLAVAFGLVDGNELRGIRQLEPASVSGAQGRVEWPQTRLPRGGREESPLVDLVEPSLVTERPQIVVPPGLEEDEEAARGRGGPEEYLGRREDRNGLHPDVLSDGAP